MFRHSASSSFKLCNYNVPTASSIQLARYRVRAKCQDALQTMDIGETAQSQIDGMRQQLEAARQAEEEARHRREDLEIRMLHYNQQLARHQRQLREQALSQWRVDNEADDSTEEPTTSSSGDEFEGGAASGPEVANGAAGAGAEKPASRDSAAAPTPRAPKKKKKKGSKKKKWSKFAISQPSAAPMPQAAGNGRVAGGMDSGPGSGGFPPGYTAVREGGSVDLSKDQPSSLDDLLDPLQRAYISFPPTADDVCVLPKPIFVVSDCTGESAAHTVRCALGQFEQFMKASCPANLVIFRFLDDERKAFEVMARAEQEDALVVYTLVDNNMVKALRTAAQLHRVQTVDLWGPLLDSMEAHLETMRSGIPLGSSGSVRPKLSPDYFKMIAAVEYTRKMDDGANPQQWTESDLLILGVSRSGKTPLSIYLGQRGYKVANLPLVAGINPPKQLFEVDQRKIVGLVIDPQVLSTIRKTRKSTMGIKDSDAEITYAQLQKVKEELAWALELYGNNPQWPVLDVTFRGVEETAARILRIMSDRLGDVHPLWRQTLLL